MSTSGYYKRYQDPVSSPFPRWTEDCDTLIKPVVINGNRIGYFITECARGNKDGYLQFRPERKNIGDPDWMIGTIPGPFYRMDIAVNPGKYFIQRSKIIADQTTEKVLLQFYCDALEEYGNRKKVLS